MMGRLVSPETVGDRMSEFLSRSKAEFSFLEGGGGACPKEIRLLMLRNELRHIAEEKRLNMALHGPVIDAAPDTALENFLRTAKSLRDKEITRRLEALIRDVSESRVCEVIGTHGLDGEADALKYFWVRPGRNGSFRLVIRVGCSAGYGSNEPLPSNLLSEVDACERRNVSSKDGSLSFHFPRLQTGGATYAVGCQAEAQFLLPLKVGSVFHKAYERASRRGLVNGTAIRRALSETIHVIVEPLGITVPVGPVLSEGVIKETSLFPDH